jgi:hypothetical protein
LYAFRIEPMHSRFDRNALVVELWDTLVLSISELLTNKRVVHIKVLPQAQCFIVFLLGYLVLRVSNLFSISTVLFETWKTGGKCFTTRLLSIDSEQRKFREDNSKAAIAVLFVVKLVLNCLRQVWQVRFFCIKYSVFWWRPVSVAFN